MFGHKHMSPAPLALFWHDGGWEVRRGEHVLERFVVLDDALRYLTSARALAA